MSKQIITIINNNSLTLTKESFVHTKSGKLYESLYLWSDKLERNVFYKIPESDLIPELLNALEYHIDKQIQAERELRETKSKIEAFALSFGFEEYPEDDKQFISSYR
jgi:hypothetical protein